MVNKDNIFSAIGKNEKDNEVKCLISLLGGNFKEELALDSDDFYVHFFNEGVSLLFNSQSYLTSVFLYVVEAEGFNEYGDWIGDGVEKFYNITQVEKALGSPDKVGGGKIGMFNRYIPLWCKYIYGDINLQYRFEKDSENIGLVVIFKDS